MNSLLTKGSESSLIGPNVIYPSFFSFLRASITPFNESLEPTSNQPLGLLREPSAWIKLDI